MKEYMKFFEKFNNNSFLIYFVPSLLSKSIKNKNKNYFNLKFKFKFNDIVPNPLKIFSLFFSYLRIIIFSFKHLIKKRKIVCICTRPGGMKNKNSYEDARFSGLERHINKKGLSVIYYCDGMG